MKTVSQARDNRMLGALIKHTHYFDVYDSFLSSLQEEIPNILEIGVYNGGSLYMWKEYFPNSKIVGIDIDEYCKQFEDPSSNIFVELGDQCDSIFLHNINEKYGPFDLIIDDGGHESYQTIFSLKTLFPMLKNGGTYVIEDTFHSYWPEYNCDREKSTYGKETGLIKLKSDITSMDFLKSLCDKVNVWAYKGEDATEAKHLRKFEELDDFENSLFSIHFYDGMCMLQKCYRVNGKSYGEPKWYGHEGR